MSEYGPPIGSPGAPYEWLRLRNGTTWYIFSKKAGIKRSLQTGDLEEAKKRYDGRFGTKIVTNPEITCNEAFELFVENSHRKPNTKKLYRGTWNGYAKDVIGHMKPVDVEPDDILRVVQAMFKGGVRTGEQLSDTTITNKTNDLSAFFTACAEVPLNCRRADSINPVKPVRKQIEKMKDKRRQEALLSGELVLENVQEAVQFVDDATIDKIATLIGTPRRNDAREARVAFQRATIVSLMPELGCRISEMLGLQVNDFRTLDRPHGSVQFNKQLNVDFIARDPQTWWTWTKNERVRKVACSPFAERTLRAYVDRGVAEGWLYADGPMWPTWSKTPRGQNDVSDAIQRITEKADLRVVSHYFRHTFATRQYDALVASGLAIEEALKEVARAMGDTPAVVKNTYLHNVNTIIHDARIAANGRQ